MPEIAEVETVRKTLLQQIKNKKIINVRVLYKNIIIGDLEQFKTRLVNQNIKDILRKGKWLIFELNDYYLLSHLRMEGKYFLKNPDMEILKHEHVVFTFDDKTDLRYHDIRKFGKMQLILKCELINNTYMLKQGLEPSDINLTANYLRNKMKNKSIPIKSILLDQSIISGLGNIYANEVLFASKINPYKKGKELNYTELKSIIINSKNIITKAIEMGGTTIKSYTSSLGVTGRFQQCLLVHKKEGLPCSICQSLIVNEKINGRSTYYCPKCQNKL